MSAVSADQPTRADVTGARIVPVFHESHGRVTRRTWLAAVDLADGSVIYCPHRHGHREKPTAADRARRAVLSLPLATVGGAK